MGRHEGGSQARLDGGLVAQNPQSGCGGTEGTGHPDRVAWPGPASQHRWTLAAAGHRHGDHEALRVGQVPSDDGASVLLGCRGQPVVEQHQICPGGTGHGDQGVTGHRSHRGDVAQRMLPSPSSPDRRCRSEPDRRVPRPPRCPPRGAASPSAVRITTAASSPIQVSPGKLGSPSRRRRFSIAANSPLTAPIRLTSSHKGDRRHSPGSQAQSKGELFKRDLHRAADKEPSPHRLGRGLGVHHAARAGALVRRERGRVRRLCADLGRGRHVRAALRGEAAQQLLGPLRSGRRGPSRGPHVHLLRERGRGAERPTTGAIPKR